MGNAVGAGADRETTSCAQATYDKIKNKVIAKQAATKLRTNAASTHCWQSSGVAAEPVPVHAAP
jgi:hypothetical protein